MFRMILPLMCVNVSFSLEFSLFEILNHNILNILTDHGTEEAPLLVPTWSQTKTLQGLEADDLAKDVRARRGTVMQTVS